MEQQNAITTTQVGQELYRVESTLAQQNYTILFNPDYLPKTMQAEGRNLFAKRQRLEAQLAANAEETRRWIERAKEWFDAASDYGPEHLLQSEKWENYYAAVVLSDDPLLGGNALLTATERDPIEQRILATGLLTGTIKAARKEQLEERARELLSSTNPCNHNFFTEATLAHCLREEGLTDKRSINKVLAREAKTYIKEEDRRQALWTVWQERDNAEIQRQRFEDGEWGEMEGVILDTFSTLAWFEMTGEIFKREWNPNPAIARELRLALWTVLNEAEEHGESIADYLLDPREEDDWIGIATFTEALRQQPLEDWYARWQSDETPAQRWMKEFGLPLLYGQEAEWWVETADKTAEELKYKEVKDDDANIYYGEHYRDSEVRDLVKSKYGKRLQEVLSNA